MPADPATLTLAEAAHRAAEVADPHNEDPEVGTFMAYLEDADEPISAVAHVSARVEEARRGGDHLPRVPPRGGRRAARASAAPLGTRRVRRRRAPRAGGRLAGGAGREG